MNQNKCVEHVYQPDPSENKNQIEFVTISLDYMSIQIFGFWYVCVCDEKKCEKRKEKKTLKMMAIKIQFMQSNPMVVWLLLQFRLRYQTSNLVAVRCNKKWKIERKPRQQNIDVVLNAQLNLNCQ